MGKKISKEILLQIKELAKLLPNAALEAYANPYTKPKVRQLISGEQGKEIFPDKAKEFKSDTNYIPELNTILLVNHERRMIKAFKQGNWEGVDVYIRGIKKLNASNEITAKVIDKTKATKLNSTGESNEL